MIGEKLLEVVVILCVSFVDCFFSVVLLLVWLGFVIVVIFGFVYIVGEFGVVLMIGGNILEKICVVLV